MKHAAVTFTGDIMCAPGLTELCTENGKRDYTPMLAKLREELKADLLVGNLETPIAGEALEFTHERYCFNSPDEFAKMLSEFGFGLLCLANNHCMDRGEEGIDNTLDTLEALGFETIGLNREGVTVRHRVIEVNGILVGFVNYTYGTNAFAHHRFIKDDTSGRVCLFQPQETLPGSIHLLESAEFIAGEVDRLYNRPSEEYDRYIKPHLDMLRADLEAAKHESDLVIAVMHSGGQYNPLPEAYTRMLADRLIELGADCVIGHHPHVIHPIEYKDGRLVAYSLGNLTCIPSICADRDGAAHSILLTLELEADDAGARLAGGYFKVIETVEGEEKLPFCRVCQDESYAELFLGDCHGSLLHKK